MSSGADFLLHGTQGAAVTARGVRIRDLTPQDCAAARLTMVSRLCRAGEATPDGGTPFVDEAVVPCGEWRSPTEAEASSLLARPDAPSDNDLLVVPLPHLAELLSARIELRRCADLSFAPDAIRACVDDLGPFCKSLEGLVCQGAWPGPGGLRNVTHRPDVRSPKRIGLHVDDWDRRPLIDRAGGRRRLAANLGLRPRYLVFLQTPVSVLAADGKLFERPFETLSAPELVGSYLMEHLSVPAARVRIDPGEAYIVNGEDIVHDGASDTPGTPDLSLHFMGHFGAPGS